jgi:hypothetical protein
MMSRLSGSLETRQESMSSATHSITQATTALAVKVHFLGSYAEPSDKDVSSWRKLGVIPCKGVMNKA